jgi:hypothetical protein
MCKSLKQINFFFSVEKRPGGSMSERSSTRVLGVSIECSLDTPNTHVLDRLLDTPSTHVLDRSLETPSTHVLDPTHMYSKNFT